MFARVVSASAQLGKLDEAIAICRSMESTWQQQKGFQGANLLVDRNTSKIISISTWATRADLDATEASGWYQDQVARFARTWVEPPTREIYEVAVQVAMAHLVGGT
jgi:heme-degrading monooxygenase HmoA